MGKKNTLLLAELIVSVLLWAAKGVTSEPLKGIGIVAENEAYRMMLIDVREEAACCPGETELIFTVTNKRTDLSRTLILHGRIARIQDIIIVERTKLVVVGELKYGGPE